jgi:hypothetical protein
MPGQRTTVYPGTEFVTTSAGESAPLRANVNAALAGENIVVAAVEGRKILVMQYVLIVSGAVLVSWQSSGGAVKGGPMSFASQGGAAPPFNPLGQVETDVGEGLVLYLSGPVQVGGHIQYVLV